VVSRNGLPVHPPSAGRPAGRINPIVPAHDEDRQDVLRPRDRRNRRAHRERGAADAPPALEAVEARLPCRSPDSPIRADNEGVQLVRRARDGSHAGRRARLAACDGSPPRPACPGPGGCADVAVRVGSKNVH